jgi:hypothetical protein
MPQKMIPDSLKIFPFKYLLYASIEEEEENGYDLTSV